MYKVHFNATIATLTHSLTLTHSCSIFTDAIDTGNELSQSLHQYAGVIKSVDSSSLLCASMRSLSDVLQTVEDMRASLVH